MSVLKDIRSLETLTLLKYLGEVYSAWKTQVGTSPLISAEKVKKLFNDLGLFPSETEVLESAMPWSLDGPNMSIVRKLGTRLPWLKTPSSASSNSARSHVKFPVNRDLYKVQTPVYEMLECASKEYSGRTSLTFHDSDIFAKEAKKWHDRGLHKSNQLTTEKDGVDPPRRTRKMSGCGGKCEVFLGGSCNPTTWREDVAIPMLKSMGITFYNPQVSHWRPELLELEFRAKERASVLFFVLDNQTRSVSAMIEAAEIAGQRRKLVLVVQSYTEQRQSICGEPVSQSEYEDLREGQLVLQRLVERQGIPVFDSIAVALNCTARVLKENLSVEEVGAQVSPTNRPNPTSLKMKETFNKLDSEGRGWLSADDACLACSALLSRRVSLSELERVIHQFCDSALDVKNLTARRVDFDQFCAVVKELRNNRERGAAVFNGQLARDIFLGGSDKDTTWRETIAIPMLKKKDLTWFDPRSQPDDDSVVAAAMEESSVLLFVITDTSRSIAAMAVAGHYIGRGRNVVLCVQQLPENACIRGETLTTLAVKDYNRGRMYLADLARRAGIPVFSNVAEAVTCAATACQQRPLKK